MIQNTCLVIVGPTAVGKTALAIQLANHFSTEIISFDSRQCFTELNIGVAKPSDDELLQVKHHFINSHSIQDTVNAAVFERYALEKANAIFKNNRIAILVGGTGLYARAFCNGIDDVPEVSAGVREHISTLYAEKGLPWLQAAVKKMDPDFFLQGEISNPQRMMRALEVKQSTGKSILDFQSGTKKQRHFNIVTIGIELPRPVLINRIHTRVDDMMQQGLLQEAAALLPYRYCNALQTVGYRELFGYLDKEYTLDKAIELIKTNTRQYAKRQMTWFKKDTSVQWCNPDFCSLLSVVKQNIQLG